MVRPIFNINNKIYWDCLSNNPNAIHLLEQNPDKIVWEWLSLNPNAIHLLEQNPDKINWIELSRNPNAIHLLEQNPDKIDWFYLSQNPNAIHLLAPLNHTKMKEQCKPFYEELVSYVFNPVRVMRIADAFGLDLDEYLELI
jgi:hypothetical protein